MRRTIAATVLAFSTALTGCASSTAGNGEGTGTPAPPRASAPSTSTAHSPTPVTTFSTPASAAPTRVPAAPPEICTSGRCTETTAADLGSGYSVTLYTAAAIDASSGSSVLELSRDEIAVSWQVAADQVAGELACSGTPTPNCVVVNGLGAHASVASGYVRDLDRLVKYAEVPSDTPNTDPIDLNGDGLIDVVTAINTYRPSYATGTVYWQSFQSTGTKFESTGCTRPARVLPTEPTAPLTGTCPG